MGEQAGEVDTISPKLLSMKMADKGYHKTKSSVVEWIDLQLVMTATDFAAALSADELAVLSEERR